VSSRAAAELTSSGDSARETAAHDATSLGTVFMEAPSFTKGVRPGVHFHGDPVGVAGARLLGDE
jgi:hypothetical protein